MFKFTETINSTTERSFTAIAKIVTIATKTMTTAEIRRTTMATPTRPTLIMKNASFF